MTDSDPDSTTNINRSGGADLNAGGDITIGGDVVGRDKITITEEVAYKVAGLANPYLGLQSFTYADHAKYAGREKLIAETAARLTAPDEPLALLFVTGASGSGKSSFVQAGVLPALEQHYAALSVKWAVFRPSRDPLAALSDALWRQLGLPQFDASADFGDFLKAHTPSQQVNVIVIDQFEELFTQSNAQPRDALFTLLTQLPPFRSTRTHIIATMRADYLPELFALPELYDIAKHGSDLRTMSVDELHEAIQQPLRVVYPDNTKRFQAELVERLAQDAAADAAYLPLLQVTLEEIWRKGTLTIGSYTNLAEAIKQRADKVLAYQDYDAAQPNQLRPSNEQAAILNLCLDLVDVSLDDEARRDVRRRRSKDELASGVPERARLIDALIQARLLSVDTEPGERTVEVDLIHETVLSNWERLRQAIAERRHELRQRVRFEQQLKEWIGQNRADDYLLSGVHLGEARELAHRDDIAVHSADAKDFVRRSVEREEAERRQELNDARKLAEAEAQRAKSEKLRADEQAQTAKKLRRFAIFLVAVFVVASIAAVVAVFFGIQSQRQAQIARSRLLVAQARAVYEDNPLLGLRLALEARSVAPETEHAAIDSALQELLHIGRLLKLGNHIEGIYTQDRNPYLILDQSGLPGEVRRLATGELMTTLSAPLKNWGTQFGPSGDYFVVSYDDRPGELRYRDTWQSVVLSGKVNAWQDYCHDGSYFLLSYDDRSSEIRSAATGAVVRAFQSSELEAGSSRHTFSPTCRYFVNCHYTNLAADSECDLYETSTGRQVALPDVVLSISFSPRDTYTLIDYRTAPDVIRQTDTDQVIASYAELPRVIYSPDDSYMIVVSQDGSNQLQWSDGRPAQPLSSEFHGFQISPDSTYFVTSDSTGINQLYQIAAQKWISLPHKLYGVTFSPSGDYFIGQQSSNSGDRPFWMELHNARTGHVFSFDSQYTLNVATFSPDETYLWVNYQGPLGGELRRTANGERVTLSGQPMGGVVFSADETYLLLTYQDGSSELWDMRKNLRLADLGLGLGSGDGGFHIDLESHRVVARYSDGRAYLLDLDWLDSIANIKSSDGLISTACWPFTQTNFFDEASLKSYLDGDEPRACQ